MIEQKPHIPVLLAEVLEALKVEQGGVFIDATFGAGGYTRAILSSPHTQVYAFDRDETVLPFARQMEQDFKGRFHFILEPFSQMNQHITEQVNGIVWDLGVSSMQIDQAQRGFSFSQDGPLDMRMSGQGASAADIVNTLPEAQLADILYRYGQEKCSRRIARMIVQERLKTPWQSTKQLADAIHKIMPYTGGGDSAMRSFQALRIYVNDELNQLQTSLNNAPDLLLPGGRLVVVSFHSLEDTIVKDFFMSQTAPKVHINRYAPQQEATEKYLFSQVSKKAVLPTTAECHANSRAHSAKLRWAEKTTNTVK